MKIKNFFLIFMLSFLFCFPKNVFANITQDGAEEIIIFHTNDIHGRLLDSDDNSKTISFPVIAAYINNGKEENHNSLWLDAGDTFHGLPIITASKGEAMTELLNIAGLDALTPGNHDFNYSPENLVNLESKAKFPILSANVFWKKNGQRLLAAQKIFTLENGIKVGVFGLVTPETLRQGNPVYMDKLNFLDIYEKSREMVKVLKPECDIIIALTHLGIQEYSNYKSIDLVNNVEGIDVIIDGHSHTELPEGMIVKNTLIAQTGCWGHNIGKVTIDIKDKKITNKKAALINKEEVAKTNLKPDEKLSETLKSIRDKNTKLLGEIIGKSPKTMTGDMMITRREETELGDLAADAILWKTGADLAMIHGGAFRVDLKEGNVTKGDVFAIFPFGNILEVRKVKGKDIKAAIEHGVEYYPLPAPTFLQVAGMTYEFDPTLPPGNRVSNITIQNAPLEEDKTYMTASIDFLFNGGDKFFMLKSNKLERQYSGINEVFEEYLRENKNFNIKKGRIKCLKEMPIPDLKNLTKNLDNNTKKAA